MQSKEGQLKNAAAHSGAYSNRAEEAIACVRETKGWLLTQDNEAVLRSKRVVLNLRGRAFWRWRGRVCGRSR
eukprot:6205263-Pleurochrysis_carterae.AAC.1